MQRWYEKDGIATHLISQHIAVLKPGMTEADAPKTVGHLYLAIPWGNKLVTIINTNLDIALRYLRTQAGHHQLALCPYPGTTDPQHTDE